MSRLDCRHVVKLRDGRRVEAVEVEYRDGWLAALAVRRRVEVDEDAKTGANVPDGLQRRTFPAGAVREVIDLEPEEGGAR